MVFSTPLFLYIFLPICLFFYYLTPAKFRNLTLLSFSLLFYFWGEQIYVLIMFASILIDYVHGLAVEHFKNQNKMTHAKFAVASSVVFNLCLLGYFKYWDFFAGAFQSMGFGFMEVLGVPLPIGISFYTFQTMSYTIDVYRGDAKAQRNIINFGAYVTLFPQLIAGPILKYKDLGDQLDQRTHSIGRFASGIEIFIIGLCKKVFLANSLGQLWEFYRDMPSSDLTSLGAWMAIIACMFQTYFDFSGYSDMAVGLGRMLGFEFTGNFNYPFIARSIADFWQRWHISLSSWFREYLYIPLGGNRCSTSRATFNLFVVWAATGFWHGANWNFVFWGLYFFVALTLERLFIRKKLEKSPKFVGHLYALLLVSFSWPIFSIEDMSHLGEYLRAMFFVGTPVMNSDFLYLSSSYGPLLLVATIAATPIPANCFRKLGENTQMVLGGVLLLLGLLGSTAYLVDATYNPFLYFRF